VIYSKTCEAAIRALIYFADHPDAAAVSVKDVTRETGVSPSYVAKIFQCLAKGRILSSARGSTGGYALQVPPSRLTLLRIIEAVDDPSTSAFTNCIMGLAKCNDKNPCPLHPIWAKAKERIRERLAVCTVADVARLGDKFRPGKQRRSFLSKQMREIFSV